MSLRVLVTQAREKAARTTKAARELGLSIREKQAKGEAVADLEASFQTANKDAVADINELNRLEAELNLEEQHNRFTQPAEQFQTGRTSGSNTPQMNRMARRKARELQAQREMFARAGVTELNFDKFKEAHAEAFLGFIREGNGGAMRQLEHYGFKPSESMALLSTSGDLGGFLVPDDFRAEVLKDLAGFAVIRPMARVERTGGSTLVFPSIQAASTDSDIYATGYTGAWQPEGYVTGGTAPTVQNQPKFGQSRIPVHVWAPNAIELTQELLADSKADLDSIVSQVIAETLALDEDSVFINGSGVGRPLGLMNSVSGLSITEVNSGAAATLTYGGIIDLFTNLPSQYRKNAKWLMNSLTFGVIMKLDDTQDRPLFPVNGLPTNILGKEIVFSEFLADCGANTNPIVFGDFRYYGIADRQELRVQRLTERYAPNIGVLPTARVGGQVLRPAAFRKQKCST